MLCLQPRVWLLGGLLLFSACRGAGTNRTPPRLTLFGLDLEAGSRLTEDALKDFTARTGIGVDLIPTSGTSSEQLASVLQLLKSRAATPDVFIVDAVWLGALHSHLLDLSPSLDADAGRHNPVLLQAGRIDGRAVSLPFYLNVGMLYYRRDLLERYGYTAPPGTWNELREMAVRIQRGERARGKRDFWAFVWQGGAYEGLTCNALEWQASFGGGTIVDSNGRVSINNPRAAEAFRMAARWIGVVSPHSVLSYTEGDGVNVFQAGNAAFLRQWSSGYARTVSAMPKDSTGVALLPAGPAGRAQTVGGFHVAASRYSPHPREAAALVSFLASAEVQMRRALKRGYLPTFDHLYREQALQEAIPPARILAVDSHAGWVLRPSAITGAKYPAVSEAYWQAVRRVLDRAATPESAVAQLDGELTELLSGGPGGTRQ